MKILVVILLALVGSIAADGPIIQSLDGSDWTVENTEEGISVPATVPGGVYSDLERAGVLETPIYYRFNDVEYRWVSKMGWNYSRTVEVSADVLSKDRVALIFEGIDTPASIYVNDVLLANVENMFVRYVIDAKSQLVEGTNSLRLVFGSPVAYSQRRFDEQLASYLVPPDCQSSVQQGECHANHIRKMQSSYSWDWGPAYPSVGIWQSCRLEAWSGAILRDVTVTTTKDDSNNWELKARLIADLAASRETTVTARATLQLEQELSVEQEVVLTPSVEGSLEAETTLTLNIVQGSGVELWWPNGYGNQALYKLSVVLVSAEFSEESSDEVNVGFRTVEIVEDLIEGKEGYTFFFRVNDVPIFAKGSNWIPADALPERLTRTYLQDLLLSAREVHTNMVRVWGGGIYELEDFYELCDELGIMIWHDFMYACSMYPTSDWFLATTTEEIRHQVRRLQHHPSIAVWAGNNENEVALHDNWYGTAENYDRYKADYIKLYIDTIRTVVVEEDTSRRYLVSSPSNGKKTDEEGYVSDEPSSKLYGDIHYYNYGANGWDWKSFPRPRFASEFGFQSFPSFETLRPVSEPEDWSWNSEFVNSRQHHGNGNTEIINQIIAHFPDPQAIDTEQGFRNVILLNQITHAVSTKTESEHYRRAMTEVQDNSEGRTMGALYWQLNDIWQGASWSSLEYGGKWKVLHYLAATFFAPVLVSPFEPSEGELSVYGISDLKVEISNLELQISIVRWDTLNNPFQVSEGSITLPPLEAHSIYSISIDDLLATAGVSSRNEAFLSFQLLTSGELLGPSNFYFLSSFRDAVGITKPNLQITDISVGQISTENYPTSFDLVVTTEAVAPFVWLEAAGIRGHFSNNGFMLYTSDVVLTFFSRDANITLEQFTDSLSVTSYADLY